MISNNDIQYIKQNADIVSVVDSRIKLKKNGKNWTACCPFHNENTPSFTVSQDKQFYHCFGCGANGDVFDFVSHYEGLSFRDSVQSVARLIGYNIKEQEIDKSHIPLKIKEQYKNDKWFVAIFEANSSEATFKDRKQYKIAKARIEGIKRRWQI